MPTFLRFIVFHLLFFLIVDYFYQLCSVCGISFVSCSG
jgi:hypothetical protein